MKNIFCGSLLTHRASPSCVGLVTNYFTRGFALFSSYPQLSIISLVELSEGSNIYQVKVKRNPISSEVLITDVGFGVSQILPILTLCYYVPEGSTLLIEQPEIHLHPKVQADLADVFIDAMKVKKIQIIIESHSEHLLRRLQRRIAEEQIHNKVMSAFFCDNNGNESKLIPLDVDSFGTIKNWPENFFGDEFGEMAAITQAIRKRKNEK